MTKFIDAAALDLAETRTHILVTHSHDDLEAFVPEGLRASLKSWLRDEPNAREMILEFLGAGEVAVMHFSLHKDKVLSHTHTKAGRARRADLPPGVNKPEGARAFLRATMQTGGKPLPEEPTKPLPGTFKDLADLRSLDLPKLRTHLLRAHETVTFREHVPVDRRALLQQFVDADPDTRAEAVRTWDPSMLTGLHYFFWLHTVGDHTHARGDGTVPLPGPTMHPKQNGTLPKPAATRPWWRRWFRSPSSTRLTEEAAVTATIP